MKLLCLADLQLGASPAFGTPAWSRLLDQELALDHIATLAADHHVDAVLLAGDLAHHRHPSEEVRAVFRRFCERIPFTTPIVGIPGDHDVAATSDVPWPVNFSRHLAVYDRPGVWHGPGFDVACLPYVSPARLVAARDGDRTTLDEDIADLLLQIARGLRDECGERAVLMMHAKQWIEGAYLPNGLPVEQLGAAMALDEVVELGFDAVVCGDLHMAQTLNEAPPVFYCGSPYVTDWGEAHHEHGVWLLDLEGSEGEPEADDGRPASTSASTPAAGGASSPSARFVAVPDRPFVTLDLNLDDEQPGAYLRFLLDEVPIEGAVVRARYSASEEQARRVDHAAVTQALYDAGAHRVTGVHAEIVRETRARVEGVDETLGELEALELWLKATPGGPSFDMADALREYTAAGLAEVNA